MAAFPARLLEGEGPLTQRIARGMRKSIENGQIRRGDKVPSSRSLATILGVSRNIVAAAYDELIAAGLLVARPGSGTYVAATLPLGNSTESPVSALQVEADESAPTLGLFGTRAASHEFQKQTAFPPPAEIMLHYWQTAADPRAEREWTRTAKNLRARRGIAEPEPLGALRLREVIARKIVTRRGIEATADDIIVVNEAQQGLDLVARVLLDPGDIALVEEPHYGAARNLFIASGASIAAIPVDADGAYFANVPNRDAKLAYLTPAYQFPTGVSMSTGRREQALLWCEQNDTWLLEDDFNGEYQYNLRRRDAIKATDRGGRVIYLATVARSISPSVRLGFLVVPPNLRDAFASAKCIMDRGTFAFDQIVLAEFIESGSYERHLLRMCRLYEAKQRRVHAALRAYLGTAAVVSTKAPGLHVFAKFPDLSAEDGEALIRVARLFGVAVDDGSTCFLEPPNCAAVLLGFGATPVEQIDEGIRMLAEAYRRVRNANGGAVLN